MKISEPVLVDTNILVYALNQDSTFHTQALTFINSILAGEIKGVLTQQNLLEFYAIITDKKRVENPLPISLALDLINNYLNSSFEIVLPTSDSTDLVLKLCKQGKIKGGKVFDAYLAATMLSNQIKTIVTVNTRDFSVFTQITAKNLEEAASLL